MEVLLTLFISAIGIIAPVLVILLSTTDFVKILFSNNMDELPETKERLFRRILALIIVLILPSIVMIIFGFITAIL